MLAFPVYYYGRKIWHCHAVEILSAYNRKAETEKITATDEAATIPDLSEARRHGRVPHGSCGHSGFRAFGT